MYPLLESSDKWEEFDLFWQLFKHFLKVESELENRTRERVVWDILGLMLLALKMEETSQEPMNVSDF